MATVLTRPGRSVEHSRSRPSPTVLLGVSAAIVTAVLVWFGTGLHAHWLLTWLIPAPMLAVAPLLRARAGFGLAVLGWALGTLNLWHYATVRLQTPVPIVLGLIVLEGALFATAVVTFAGLVRRGRPVAAAIATPAVAVVLDHLLSWLSPHGTFTSLAWTQAGTPLLPVVAITGAAGLVGLLWAAPAAAVAVGWAARAPGSRRAPVAVLAAALSAAVLGAGLGMLTQGGGGDLVRVAMVSVPTGGDGPDRLGSAAGRTVLAQSADGVRAAAAQGARYVVLAESSLWVRRDDVPGVVQEMRQAAGPETAVVLGVVVEEPGGAFHNTALLVAPDRVAEYHKRHLVPGAETGVTPGNSTLVADVLGQRVAVVICKDLDFPWTIRESAQAGARLVLAPAWDFTVDGWQHSQMATVRAAEGEFALVRPARDGLDVVTDHRGQVVHSSSTVTEPHQVVVSDVRVGDRTTAFTRFGDWLWVMALAALGGIGVSVGVSTAGRRR